MNLEARLARRNLGRNPRRSGLTVAATVFAVMLVVVFVGMGAGQHERMIEDGVRMASGHLAISARGYRDNQTLEYYVELDPALEGSLADLPELRGWAPRLTSFGLLSHEQHTRAVGVIGVDPRREPEVSMWADRIDEGRFVSAGHTGGIVLGGALAEHLGVGLGDEVLLYGQAYSLETAYELFRVVGTLSLPDRGLERNLALISLDDAQRFFVYGDRVSEIALLAEDTDAVPALEEALAPRLEGRRPPLEVRTWSELMPDLAQLIFLDDAGMYLMLAILVVVVGFGILNTILMGVLERQREFGVLLALGLRPASIFRVVMLESLGLAAIGAALGLAVGVSAVVWLQGHPIPLTGETAEAMRELGFEPVLVWKLKPLNPIGSTFTILGVAALAALGPALKAARARPVDALRSL